MLFHNIQLDDADDHDTTSDESIPNSFFAENHVNLVMGKGVGHI